MNQQPHSPTPFQLPTLRLGLRRLALLGGLGVLTVVFLITLGGGQDALAALLTVDLRWIAVGIAIHYSGFVVRGVRWQRRKTRGNAHRACLRRGTIAARRGAGLCMRH